MTTISSALAGNYYQLSNQTNTNQSGTSLADILSQSTGASTSSSATSPTSELTALLNGDSDVVDLSPQAQGILDQFSQSQGSSSGFTLTSKDQTAISNIIAKYKDAPFTQDTFNSIQDDLSNAGLSADKLAQKDSAQSFNPTLALLNALNGINTSIVTAPDSSAEQGKSQQFMQSVIQQWQQISSTASSAAASATPTASTTGASAQPSS